VAIISRGPVLSDRRAETVGWAGTTFKPGRGLPIQSCRESIYSRPIAWMDVKIMPIAARLTALLITALVALPGGAAAREASLPPDEFSAADQYKESVPTSRGPRVSAVERRRSSRLPPAVSARLDREQGPVATRLEQAATSSRYGAPQRKLESHRRADTPGVPAAAIGAADASGGGALPWLLIALLVITAFVTGAAAHRHYQHRKTANRL
jgi:hypothetical protein